MPDDVGGRPFPDGWEPDDDRGGADQDFASVVFDEDFVRAAEIHEPSAVERLLAAAQARAEAEAARARSGAGPADDELYDDGRGPADYGRERGHGDLDPDGLDGYADPYGPHGGALRPYRGAARWYRPVAWVLAVVMGVGMVALAFTAVYRGAAAGRQDRVPTPTTTGVDVPARGTVPDRGTHPSASAEYSAPPVSAVPRTP
ncbi:hypothetical protein E3E14_07005 [Streptomyces sp. ICN441]|uniref:Uncharacterized protein n=1 Tax=Streptomyces tirandamycinicus TaxID=2174846 RepID=A0A2S1SQW8_9ACTN|nr:MULTISPECIES: hypothetical protein [Streptomyces]AWI28775.1 hypothetical protein DDW44_08215 [Streptomyces tirandamycinicus]TFE54815.1 hypothetical protein E3E14_07005 [Streptomyces sp. ICN441]